MTAVLVAKNYTCSKAGVDTKLVESDKILPRNGWLRAGARAISDDTGPGGCSVGDSTATRIMMSPR
jgi:hypothetical protein